MPLGQPEIRRFASQRLSLAYADWGNHDAPLLALVHGGRDHKRSWDWTADALKDEFHVVAPDLRGHGESDWASDGDYSMADYVLDLAALFKHLGKEPQTIVAHSLGGMVALRYAGLFPERVRRIVAVEGLGMSPRMIAEQEAKPVSERLRAWVDKRLANTERPLKRYPDIAAATARMREANPHLSEEQAHHLTLHGVRRHEDGSLSFAYDPDVFFFPATDISSAELRALWARIDCPALLLYGRDGTASNPLEDGRASAFRNAEVLYFDKAGHWLHHDRFEMFLAAIRAFIR